MADTAAAAGATTLVCPTDLTVDEQVDALARAVEQAAGRLDVLVHCAGTIHHSALEEGHVEELDAQYAANVRSPYRLTHVLLPMLKASKGQIAFINSSVYLHARAGVGQFASTQYALKAVADSLRDEVNRDGVRVLSVFPGRTATPRQEHLHELEGKSYRPELLMQPEDVAAIVVSALALPRTAEVTDIHMRPMAKPV